MDFKSRLSEFDNKYKMSLSNSPQVSIAELKMLRYRDELTLKKPTSNLVSAFDILTNLPDNFFCR